MKLIPITLDKTVKNLNTLFKKSNSFIAGGAVRSIHNKEQFSDIDVFTQDSGMYEHLVQDLQDTGYNLVFRNPMLTRFQTETAFIDEESIQQSFFIDAVVPRVAEFMQTQGTPEQVISHFDFSVARAAIISGTEALVDEDFEKDCKSKTLRIKHIVCPLSSVKRIGKYMAKGYSISITEILKLFREYQNRDTTLMEELLGKKDLSPSEIAKLMQWVYID